MLQVLFCYYNIKCLKIDVFYHEEALIAVKKHYKNAKNKINLASRDEHPVNSSLLPLLIRTTDEKSPVYFPGGSK